MHLHERGDGGRGCGGGMVKGGSNVGVCGAWFFWG